MRPETLNLSPILILLLALVLTGAGCAAEGALPSSPQLETDADDPDGTSQDDADEPVDPGDDSEEDDPEETEDPEDDPEEDPDDPEEDPDDPEEDPDDPDDDPEEDPDDPDDDPEGDPEDPEDPDDPDDPEEDPEDTCATAGDHEACADDEMCWDGACEQVLGEEFRVTVVSGAVGPADPYGSSWDQWGGAPDLFVAFAPAGEPWFVTYTAWDSFSATWNQYYDATFEAGGAFYLEQYDFDGSTNADAGAWYYVGSDALVDLARTSGEVQTLEDPVDPATRIQVLVTPLF
ncbi:hypothetical protein H8E07_05215 [bacterium]|nr:hypothetical protein [bacterium]